MKIYLYLTEKIVSFTLPQEIMGSYSFDEDPEEEIKLINIEARDEEWVLYSTSDVNIISNNNEIVDSIKILPDNFYIIKRDNKNYLIYTSDLTLNNISTYKYDQNINLTIGNTTDNSIQYPCPFMKDLVVTINYSDNKLLLKKNKNLGGVYVDNKAIIQEEYYINIGDQISIFGLKIIFSNGIIFINNVGTKTNILEEKANISKYMLPESEQNENIEIKDVNLYEKDDYFSKSPRIRRIIETKVIKLSPPPRQNDNEELPAILTIGPMLTMGMSSGITILNTVLKLTSGEGDIKTLWPSLLTSSAMMLSMILWPNLIRKYNKKLKKKKKEELIDKYTVYLNEKRKELDAETKTQKDILVENLISVGDCLKIIQSRGMNFWDKRVEQSDFLVVRIGHGNKLLDAKIEYSEEDFTKEEDALRKKADEMVAEYKYIENVPVGYSFYDNIVTAIMGNKYKSSFFVSNIILQLITYYSYEDLKLVVFTKESNKENWDYLKYLNHSFSNDKSIRFFATNSESAKNVSEYLNFEVSNRLGNKDADKKPHYFIIIDDYNSVKRFDFIKTITESDENLGFSIVIIEERLSKLPSKCNNFISLGQQQSGVLKNSYEKQEQLIFQDEINYGINMMNVAKILSNIPIEFEAGISKLPDAVTFMEMERIGKVEQLNILNRWNTNDATTSLKAEVGVDEQGDYIYLDLHEKFHGPHGLIAGTTGSGKSEFIITYILSMCINYSPDDVAFILIDYKGGGLALAFENKTQGIVLPHLAGTITNLDKAEMDRTLVSIDSEVKRRQAMFNEAREIVGESTIDIYKYQRHYNEGRLKEPIPHLFIICDEFAELKSQQPEFMDNLISVARIGRSLGVHLILATQKPSGVVNDQIWSNTRFRVCLKVQDESDSKEMLKRPEAASIRQAGRFYLQVGYDELFILGQSGWCGAKYYPSEKIVKQVDKSINFIDDCGNFIKSIQASKGINIEPQGEQLANILNSIIDTSNKIGKKARKLWLDSIPEKILINELEQKYNITTTPYNVEAVLGEYDAPEFQEQGIVQYNYLTDGNTIIYGNDGTERENLLNTLIYSTTKNHTSEEINYYMIDYGSESLRRYQGLPHVGGIVFQGEDEKYNNLFKLIKEEVQERKKLFVNYGGEYSAYIKNNPNKLPLKVFIFNNYDAINESNQTLYETLPELVRDSDRYGIIFILTANSTNSVYSKVSSNFKNIYALKLKDALDYTNVFGLKNKLYPRDIIGRGIIKNNGLHEFQTASIILEEDELNNYLIEFINKQKETNLVKAKRIPTLPKIIRYNDIEREISTLKNVPVGISKKDLEICNYDYTINLGNIITSVKLANTNKFIKSLLNIFRRIPNNNLIIIDPLSLLELNKTEYPNYYHDSNNLSSIIDMLIDFIKKLIETKTTKEGIILIYGLNKFITKLDDSQKLGELTKLIKQYEKISVIVADDAAKIKSYIFESWFTEIFSLNDGIWIGRGIAEQNLLKLSGINKEMTQDIKTEMGYFLQDNVPTLCKFIDFITSDEEEEDKNGE